jgi:CubicO group peptidase (beta-lactamase class C family)
MPFIRSIGRWTLTALVINCIIGSDIFGVPSVLTRLPGRPSPTSIIGVAILSNAAAQLSSAQGGVQHSSELADHILRVENEFPPVSLGHDEPPLRFDLATLMKLFKVPALSVAVIEDYKIAWAKGYGVTEAGGATPVTTRTLFQAGSISKPVAAAAALHLVEDGRLSLDEDVNRKLKSWKIPENDFTKQQKVTLRRLMTHTAGVNENSFYGYDVDDPIPTLVQVLNGEKPANNGPIRVDFVPGSKMRYSGGGVTIEQQLVMDIKGEPFPQLMKEIVFDMIGMEDSTFEQPLPPARRLDAASGTYPNGTTIHGKWHVYPEMAAAGLWTTPSDLAKFAVEIALSHHGKSNRILSQKMAKEMLTPQVENTEEPFGQMGLSFFIDKKNPAEFGHGGADWAFQAVLIAFADNGKGAVIMTNSDNGFYVMDRLIESIAQEYHWNYKSLDQNAGALLGVIAMAKGAQAAIQKCHDLKKTTSSSYQLDESSLDQVGHTLLESGKTLDAIEVFKANVQNYPKSADVYASLGEAYMRSEQKQLALENYEKSLTLAPSNASAIEGIKKLKEQK